MILMSFSHVLCCRRQDREKFVQNNRGRFRSSDDDGNAEGVFEPIKEEEESSEEEAGDSADESTLGQI